jgi:hypothetical protein
MTGLPRIIPLELTRAVIIIAGWWALYCKLHRPPTLARRVALLVCMTVLYSYWMWIMNIPWGMVGDAFFWAGMQLLFAFLAGDWRNSFFTALFYIGVEQVIDVTRSCAVAWIRGDWFASRSVAQYIQGNLQYLFVLCWAIFYYRTMRNRKRDMPWRFWIMTLGSPIAVFLLLTRFTELAEPLLYQGVNFFGVGAAIGIIFFISHHFSFYLYIRQMKLFDLEIQAATLQSHLGAQTRQNRLIEDAQKQASEIRHEMKNLLFALQIELSNKNYAGIETRLNALLGEMKQYELKPYTAIPVIDAMIACKGETLRQSGVDFLISAETLFVSDSCAYDIASILAIALDNAIDAVVQRSGKAGAVRVAINRRKNLVVIRISNPLTKPLAYQGGELQSTKNEPGHGLGLPALRRIVDRYSGNLTISGKDGVFLLEIMLMDSGTRRPSSK